MKKLIVYFGDNPVCVEGFSSDCQRSVEGALHVHPRKPITVTDGEYRHMLGAHPEMHSKLKVVAEVKPEASKAEAEAGSPAEAQPSMPEKAAGDDESPASSPQPEEKGSHEDGKKSKKRY